MKGNTHRVRLLGKKRQTKRIRGKWGIFASTPRVVAGFRYGYTVLRAGSSVLLLHVSPVQSRYLTVEAACLRFRAFSRSQTEVKVTVRERCKIFFFF